MFGEFCSCSWLLFLPGFACSIHATWDPPFIQSRTLLSVTLSSFTLQVWKAEADNICGYEGTVLVGVKAAKDNAPQKEVGHLVLFLINVFF